MCDNIPIIFIVCDQLVAIDNLSEEIKSTLIGINKFKKRCLYFDNFYNNSQPCSPARSVMYTGKHVNVTHVTDNLEMSWQKTMTTSISGLKTYGSYFNESRYIGKCHFSKKLDPNEYIRSSPRLSTANYLREYDFKKFNKMSDFCYDPRVAFMNDQLVMEQKLPKTSIEADYYDKITHIAYDGIIPYLKSKPKNFFVCANFDQPHDITYSNIKTDIEGLSTTTTQMNGLSETLNSVAEYNLNYRLFNDVKLLNKKTILENNVQDSSFELGIVSQLYLKYFMYGIYEKNEEQFREYQIAYYRSLKHLDDNLNELYDFFGRK